MGVTAALGLDSLTRARKRAAAIAGTVAKLEAERPALERALADAKAKAVSLLEANPDRAVNLGTAAPLAALAENDAALDVAREAQRRIGADLESAEAEARQKRAAESLARREAAIRAAESEAGVLLGKLADVIGKGEAASFGLADVARLADPGGSAGRCVRPFALDAVAEAVATSLRERLPADGYVRNVFHERIDLPYPAPHALPSFDDVLEDSATTTV